MPLVTGLALVAAGCGGADTDTSASGSSTVCEEVAVPAPEERTREAPGEPLEAGKTYTLTFETNCGTFVVMLDRETAPKTAASLVALAESGFYDATVVHRIVPDFVIQGGDPTQEGNGGPGYATVDAPPEGTTYVKGVVAMAKTSVDPPGTSGSQWFVVTAEDAGLPADYAVVGRVSDGLDVVEKIGQLGDEAEQPTEPVVVEAVTVGRS